MSAEQAANLAIRLDKQFGSVHDARLPELYVNAQNGLAQCVRVDECKAWADKAEAIRSYARQAKDDELMRTAMRIKGRAIERLGSLLEELEKDVGGRQLVGTPKPITARQEAVTSAGISKDQAARAQAVARFAKQEPERFEKMVERSKPATVTELAREGRKAMPPPKTAHLMGHSPEDFKVATRALGAARTMAEQIAHCPPATVVKTVTARERASMLCDVQVIGKWIVEITKHLRSNT